MLAEAMAELNPVNLEGTRWMPHQNNCLDVLLRRYLVFGNHFENTVEAILVLSMFEAEQNLIYLKAPKGQQPFESHALLNRCPCCS